MKAKMLAAALMLLACSGQPMPEPSAAAVDATLLQVAAWGVAHKAPAEDVAELTAALQKHKYVQALDTAKKLLADSEVAGEYVPKELQQAVDAAAKLAHATEADAGR